AATGVKVDHPRVRNHRKQFEDWACADQRALVTMHLHQDSLRTLFPVHWRTSLRHERRGKELLKRLTSLGDDLSVRAQLTLEERRVVITQRQDATRLTSNDPSAAL